MNVYIGTPRIKMKLHSHGLFDHPRSKTKNVAAAQTIKFSSNKNVLQADSVYIYIMCSVCVCIYKVFNNAFDRLPSWQVLIVVS